MKKAFSTLIVFVVLMGLGLTAQARNTIEHHPIHEALQADKAANLDPAIKLYFAGQSHPQVISHLGHFKSNRKTNAFNKTDQAACNVAFLSALRALQNRAHDLGGNAVINIKSFYKKRTFSSSTQFECGAGAMVAGVVLKGDVVKLAK